MKHIGIKALIILILLYGTGKAEEARMKDSMILHPEQYIKITNWSFYVASRVAIIHHVTIENRSDIGYKDIEVRVRYYSTSYSNYRTPVGGETGILHITLPPHTKKTYIQGGAVLGSGSSLFYADNIEVLGAIPLTYGGQIKRFPKLEL
ncbi:MAG: hypothetical protein C4291_13480 [Candidatus Dadabacteria bacterium]